ncbi:hypothetical protein BBK82_37585 [Lentzea guizhouensis]|uniref:Maltokinase n=1 Tax=Lentzea guizhouensis TaxID=1586287 RepID=A0A1B2HT19_9PSEU|nr:hypothetical protein [Lentzea guizhouensis]ANZ40853.1 hypothetical protein BBK82_37585 [Lentzea guizhouensis]
MTTSETVGVVPEQLDRWLVAQPWYRGRGPVECERVTVLRDGDPALVHVVLAVGGRRYQLLLGVRDELPERLVHARIGTAGEREVYEAVHDPELTAALLQHFEESTEVEGLWFRGALPPRYTDAPVGRPFPGPQRNFSIVYGQRHVLKFFRELTPGDNPELVLHTALHSIDDPHIAPPQGALEAELDGVRTTFAVLHEFVPLGALGWPMATASVRDFLAGPGVDPQAAGGDFASEAHRLGRAVAGARRPAETLGERTAGPDDEAEFVAALHRRLDAALDWVPALAPFEAGLRARFDEVLASAEPIRLQRVHGDLHLGQVLRSPRTWVLVDFEGEPHGGPAERTRPRPAEHDVATALRSLHYAAAQLLVGADDVTTLLPRAARWLERNRTAFCAGYAEVAPDRRPGGALLTAVELDRAVLEVCHEQRFRPEWTVIPLSAIAEAVTGEPAWLV